MTDTGTAPDDQPRDLAAKVRAYLTARDWTHTASGPAGAMWIAPAGTLPVAVAVPNEMGAEGGDPHLFGSVVKRIADAECRQTPLVAADILEPAVAEPAYGYARALEWTRIPGTDVEVLADLDVRLCVRKAEAERDELRAEVERLTGLRRTADHNALRPAATEGES